MVDTRFVANYTVDGVTGASLQEMFSYIIGKKVLGIDIETSRKFKQGEYDESIYRGGLDPYLSNIVMLQIGDLKRSYVIDTRCYTNEQLKPLLDYLHYNDKLLLVAHNVKFEGKHLRHKYGLRLKNVWDTMLVDINLTNGLSLRYSLAHLAKRYLGIKKVEDINLFNKLEKKKVSLNDIHVKSNKHLLTAFEIEDDFIIDKSTRMQFITIGDRKFTKQQINYGSDDIVLPLLIRERQMLGRKLGNGTSYNPFKCHKVENAFSQVIADIELVGLGFSKERWIQVAEDNKKEYEQRKKDFEDYVLAVHPEWSMQHDLFNPNPTCRIEWTSPKQVVYLFRKLNICPKERSKQTKKMEWTVGAAALLKTVPMDLKTAYLRNNWVGFEKEDGEYVVDHEKLVINYLLLNKSTQAITTFGVDWLKYVHPITGRIHSNYRQILNTGRMSSSNPNLQNLPNSEAFRSCFIAKQGNKMINSDYAAQEIRVVADVTGDAAFIDFFLSSDSIFGDDFHSYTATKMYRIMNDDPDLVVPPKSLVDEFGEEYDNPAFTPDHKKMRNNAKAINFKINYGGSAYSLKDDFGVEEDVAQMFIDTYLDAFPTLRDNFEITKRKAVKYGYVQIDEICDRRWFCPFFRQMESLNEEIRKYFPDDYFSGAYDKESRAKIKAQLYRDYPEIPEKWSNYFSMRGSLERAGLNYRIQGKSASQMKVAMNILRGREITENLPIILTNLVHDEAVAESPESSSKEMGQVLSDCMVIGGNYFVKSVVMKATPVVSDVWEH